MVTIKLFYIPEILLNVIKNQALSSEHEIYGWLLGFQKDDIPNVLAILECKRFEQQSTISAIPDVKEFHEISSVMPQGIGPIGIYHSHPFSSEVFHSHTDDATLISLSNQFPNCVSIVTNGKQTHFYQMGNKSQIKEIKAKNISPEIPKFLLISLSEKFLIKIKKTILDNINDANNLKVRVVNAMSNYLENAWSNMELFLKNLKVSEDKLIKKYLVNQLTAEPIKLKIPSILKTNSIEQLIINDDEKPISKDDFINNDYIPFSLDLSLKIPIYSSIETKTFKDLNNLIKSEIVFNNLLQKVFNSVIDDKNRKIIAPIEYHLNFFGFYLKILCFNKPELNNFGFSQKNFEFFNKILVSFNSFSNLELSKKVKSHIMTFLNDIKKVSKNFAWQNELINIIINLEKSINSDKKKLEL
ncbi:MAG: Mov34/MPN/PAD-1 family protein [Promethearchaeota archaeon]